MTENFEYDIIYIDISGDASVGLFPFTMEISGFNLIEQTEEEIEEAREHFKQCFSKFWGEKVSVSFDFEEDKIQERRLHE